jgi:hypothetical protein
MNLNPSCSMILSPAQSRLLSAIHDAMNVFQERTMRWPDRVLLGRSEWSTMSSKETTNFYVEGVEVSVLPQVWSMIAPILDHQP